MNAPVEISRSSRERATPDTPPAGKYKLRLSDYLLLDEAGTFRDHETELVDGDVIVMSPEWIPHMRIKDELAYQLRRTIEAQGLGLFVGTGGSVALSDVDSPRPDVIVMRRLEGDHAVAREWVLLLIEVSSSTFSFDAGEKVALYARAGIPEYWIVDVNARLVHQLWTPAGDTYAEGRQVSFGNPIAAATIDGLTVTTDGL